MQVFTCFIRYVSWCMSGPVRVETLWNHLLSYYVQCNNHGVLIPKSYMIVTCFVSQAFSSLLKRDVAINFKTKGNMLVSVLACNSLLAAFQDEENWPDNFVKVWFGLVALNTVKSVLRDHCHERPPVLTNHNFVANGAVCQDSRQVLLYMYIEI